MIKNKIKKRSPLRNRAVRLTDQQWKLLEAKSIKDDVRVSDVIRAAVDYYLGS